MKHLTRCMMLLFCTFIFLIISAEISDAELLVSGGDSVTQAEFNKYFKAFVQIRYDGSMPGSIPGPGGPTSNYNCGGTLVAPNKVLTAAHCVQLAEVHFFELAVLVNGGVTKTDIPLAGTDPNRYAVSSRQMHPSYDPLIDQEDPASAAFDIAVLTLDRDVPSSSNGGVDPVLLDPREINQDMIAANGLILTAIGYGHKPDGSAKNTLTSGAFPAVLDTECPVSGDTSLSEVQHTTVCVQSSFQHTAWGGDSGSPVFIDYGSGDHRYRQIGVVEGSAIRTDFSNLLFTVFDNQEHGSGDMTVLEFLQSEGIGRAFASSTVLELLQTEGIGRASGEYYQLWDMNSNHTTAVCLTAALKMGSIYRWNNQICGNDGSDEALSDLWRYWSLPPTDDYGPMVNAATGECLEFKTFADIAVDGGLATKPCDATRDEQKFFYNDDGEIVNLLYSVDEFALPQHRWMTGRALSPRPLLSATEDSDNLYASVNQEAQQKALGVTTSKGSATNWHMPPAGYNGIMATEKTTGGDAGSLNDGQLFCAHIKPLDEVQVFGRGECGNARAEGEELETLDGGIWYGMPGSGEPGWATEYVTKGDESTTNRMFTNEAGEIKYGAPPSSSTIGWYQWFEDAQAPTIGLLEDFDDGDLAGWTVTGLWHLIDDTNTCAGAAHPSLPNAMYYGQDSTCNYDTGSVANSGELLSPVIDTLGANATLTFSHFREVESYYMDFDKTEVYVRAVDTDWPTEPQWSRDARDASVAGFNTESIDLAEFADQRIEVKFVFDSGDRWANDYTGWIIDDIEVNSIQLNSVSDDLTISIVKSGVTEVHTMEEVTQTVLDPGIANNDCQIDDFGVAHNCYAMYQLETTVESESLDKNEASISLWFKADLSTATAGNGELFRAAHHNGIGGHDKSIWLEDGQILTYIRNPVDTATCDASPHCLYSYNWRLKSAAGINYADGEWHHVEMSYGPAGYQLRMDQVLVDSTTAVTGSAEGSFKFFIGDFNPDQPTWFQRFTGWIKDIVVIDGPSD